MGNSVLTPEQQSRIEEIKQHIKRADHMVAMLCTGDRDWLMSIPARPDYDPDIIISKALKGASDLVALVESQAKDIACLNVQWREQANILNEQAKELASLRSQLSAAQQGWQPIDTYRPGIDPQFALVYWPHWSSTPVSAVWSPRLNDWFAYCAASEGPGPTHWMPLPATPVSSSTAERER